MSRTPSGIVTLSSRGQPSNAESPISVTLAWQSYLMLGVWLLAGVVLMLRLPRGIRPGPDAEEELKAALQRRRDR